MIAGQGRPSTLLILMMALCLRVNSAMRLARDGAPLDGRPTQADGAGRVFAGEDILLEGTAEEALGLAVCADFAAGVHNLRSMPNATWIRSVRGEGDLALESGAPWGRTVLACDGERLAIGQPNFEGGGRVWVVETLP